MSRNITIVPEIDMPGHASAPIAAYPKLGCASMERPSADPHAPADWGVSPICTTSKSRRSRSSKRCDELKLWRCFRANTFTSAGDEAVKDQWKASRRVQARMRELGVKLTSMPCRATSFSAWRSFLSAQRPALDRLGRDSRRRPRAERHGNVVARHRWALAAAAAAGHDTVLSPQPTLYSEPSSF